MNTVHITIWAIIAALVLFTIIGAVLLVTSLRPEPGRRRYGEGSRGFRAGVQRYVGPVSPKLGLLTPLKRVALEFVAALCGFPGFGWMMSGRVAIGLPLLCIAPAVIYGFYPVYLAFSGHFLDSPYVALRYLPAVAIISASTLAVVEVRYTRGARHEP